MRKRILTLTLVMGSVFLLNQAGAQMGSPGMMHNIEKQQQSAQQRQQNYPAMIGSYYGMGLGMMTGFGMGHGMMPGYGMGYGMMGGYGYC